MNNTEYDSMEVFENNTPEISLFDIKTREEKYRLTKLEEKLVADYMRGEKIIIFDFELGRDNTCIWDDFVICRAGSVITLEDKFRLVGLEERMEAAFAKSDIILFKIPKNIYCELFVDTIIEKIKECSSYAYSYKMVIESAYLDSYTRYAIHNMQVALTRSGVDIAFYETVTANQPYEVQDLKHANMNVNLQKKKIQKKITSDADQEEYVW